MNKADYQDTLKQFFSDKSKSKNIKKNETKLTVYSRVWENFW